MVASASLLPALTLATGRLQYNWHVGVVLFLLVSFGYVVNDIYDMGGDRIDSAQRPLVQGDLSVGAAWVLAGVLAVASLILSYIYSLDLLLYCLTLVVALFAYAAYLSTLLLVANLWVASMCSSVFILPIILGQISAQDSSCLLLAYAVILSFLYHLGREIVKDIEDMRGDTVLSRATLPLVVGASRSRTVAAAVFAAMIVAAYYVYYQMPSHMYLWVITLGVGLPIFAVFGVYLRRDPAKFAGRVSMALKIIMLPALAALLALGLK